MGYARAGFEVTGVDIEPMPHYPFQFVQADAVAFLALNGFSFDVIHASPPCQAYTTMGNRYRGQGGKADSHARMISATRDLMPRFTPYIIENVTGARDDLLEPVLLRGNMFGLTVDRPRLFETNWELVAPQRISASRVPAVGVYGKAPDGRRLFDRADGQMQRAASSLTQAQLVMGIDWMPWPELTQAIPPAYTEHIGRQLLSLMGRA